MECIEPKPANQQSHEWSLTIAIVTPVMSRILQNVRHSGELVFMESTGNLEELNSRFSMMCTQSPAGALPVAVFRTSNERAHTLKIALQ